MFLPLTLDEDGLGQIDKLETDQRKNLVNKCVQAIIVLAQDRQPVKKQDLNRLAFLTITNYRLTAAIIILANMELDKVFGMRLFETDCRTKYFLVNADTKYAKLAVRSHEMQKELSILFFILLDIFVSVDEKVSEEDLANSLKPLNMTSAEFKALLDSFVKKLYLVQMKSQETRMFAWGARAVAEVEPDNFFNRFLELTDDQNEKNFPEIKKRIATLKQLRGF